MLVERGAYVIAQFTHGCRAMANTENVTGGQKVCCAILFIDRRYCSEAIPERNGRIGYRLRPRCVTCLCTCMSKCPKTTVLEVGTERSH